MQLCRRLFRHWSTNHHEAPQSRPPMRAVSKLCRPQPRRNLVIAQPAKPTFHGAGQLGDDRVEPLVLLNKFDNFMIEKCSICTHSHFSDWPRQLRKGALQHGYRDRGGLRVPRMVAALPTILRVPFKAQQRKIGGASPLLRVVAHFGSFLVAIDREHSAVQIEDDLRWVTDHLCTPTIVQFEKGVPPRVCETV